MHIDVIETYLGGKTNHFVMLDLMHQTLSNMFLINHLLDELYNTVSFGKF